jgi:hypothetical protein
MVNSNNATIFGGVLGSIGFLVTGLYGPQIKSSIFSSTAEDIAYIQEGLIDAGEGDTILEGVILPFVGDVGIGINVGTGYILEEGVDGLGVGRLSVVGEGGSELGEDLVGLIEEEEDEGELILANFNDGEIVEEFLEDLDLGEEELGVGANTVNELESMVEDIGLETEDLVEDFTIELEDEIGEELLADLGGDIGLEAGLEAGLDLAFDFLIFL